MLTHVCTTVSYPYQSPIPPLTTISQLAYALGPDNTFHTTEIDTVPCAGIRIPQGPLTGLLAWRLVVRLAPSAKEKRGWWNENKDRRNSYAAPLVQTLRPRAQPYKGAPRICNPSTSTSTLSLPLLAQTLSPGAGSFKDFPQKSQQSSVILTRQARISKPHSQTTNRSQPQLAQTLPSLPSALTVNFILDTSLPYSIISRDALIALGYPPHLIPSPLMSHLAGMPQDNINPAMVTLSIQNILTRFHIARPNEASKLGVQFLHDAGVSVFFPKDGEGVGPVLYGKFSFFFFISVNSITTCQTVESARLLKDVPRTIPLQGIGVKLTLPQRVRALLGLS